MTWTDGPPPETVRDGKVILVVLSPDRFSAAHPDPWDEYYGDPVALRWYGHKGKTTFGLKRIDPEDVLSWADPGWGT